MKTTKDPSHYSPEQWADYARDLLSPETREPMALHLQSGCEQCRRTLEWLQSVTRNAAATLHDPPAHLVSQAKAIFPSARQPQAQPSIKGWFEEFETLLANLVMVNAADLRPQGVRSGSAAASAPERLVYKAGQYTVDLTMDEGVRFGQPGEIIGQINDETGQAALEGTVVQLHSGGKVLGETETNAFGEFLLQRPSRKPATLRFAVRSRKQKVELRLRSGEEQIRE